MSEIRPSLSAEEQSSAEFIGGRLGELSTSLVAEWSGGDPSRARTITGDGCTDQALLAHIAATLATIGRYVSDPAFEFRREIRRQLSGTAAVWRSPDRSTPDLLVWMDGLSELTMQRMQQEVARFGGYRDVSLALAAFERLARGLRDMASVILDLHLNGDSGRYPSSLRQQEANRLFAHELRTPLHTITLCAAILESPGLGTDVKMRQQQLKIIRSALAQAESLLEHADLLKGSSDAPSSGHTTALKTVIESVAEELSGRAMASDVELILPTVVPPLAVETVVAHLVLSNLMINAIKYADQAKPARWLTVRAEITEGDDPRFVTVEVADNGIGIPASLQRHVFERSFRAHPQVAEGDGLGLTIASGILGERGGSIDLISQERIGSAVRFRLPTFPIEAGNHRLTSVTELRAPVSDHRKGASCQRVV